MKEDWMVWCRSLRHSLWKMIWIILCISHLLVIQVFFKLPRGVNCTVAHKDYHKLKIREIIVGGAWIEGSPSVYDCTYHCNKCHRQFHRSEKMTALNGWHPATYADGTLVGMPPSGYHIKYRGRFYP